MSLPPINKFSSHSQGVSGLDAFAQNAEASLDNAYNEHDQTLIDEDDGHNNKEWAMKINEYETRAKMKQQEINDLKGQMMSLISNKLNASHNNIGDSLTDFRERVENESKSNIEDLKNQIKSLENDMYNITEDFMKELASAENKKLDINAMKEAHDSQISDLECQKCDLEYQINEIKESDQAKYESYRKELEEKEERDRHERDQVIQNLTDQLATKRNELTQITNNQITYRQKVSDAQSKIFELNLKKQKAENDKMLAKRKKEQQEQAALRKAKLQQIAAQIEANKLRHEKELEQKAKQYEAELENQRQAYAQQLKQKREELEQKRKDAAEELDKKRKTDRLPKNAKEENAAKIIAQKPVIISQKNRAKEVGKKRQTSGLPTNAKEETAAKIKAQKPVIISQKNSLDYYPIVSTFSGLHRALSGLVSLIKNVAKTIFCQQTLGKSVQEAGKNIYHIGRGLLAMIPIVGNVALYKFDQSRITTPDSDLS